MRALEMTNACTAKKVCQEPVRKKNVIDMETKEKMWNQILKAIHFIFLKFTIEIKIKYFPGVSLNGNALQDKLIFVPLCWRQFC